MADKNGIYTNTDFGVYFVGAQYHGDPRFSAIAVTKPRLSFLSSQTESIRRARPNKRKVQTEFAMASHQPPSFSPANQSLGLPSARENPATFFFAEGFMVTIMILIWMIWTLTFTVYVRLVSLPLDAISIIMTASPI